jgi:hypothetical protein
MSLIVFIVLIGGSMVLTTAVWVYLLVIAVKQFRGEFGADPEAA